MKTLVVADFFAVVEDFPMGFKKQEYPYLWDWIIGQ